MNLELSPINQLRLLAPSSGGKPARWRATGNDPSFDVVLPNEGLAGGWYELDLQVDVSRGRVHLPALYPDYRRGYVVEAESAVLPLLDARTGLQKLKRLVLFTEGVSRLRFDPSVIPCELAIERFSLRKLGRLEAARTMFMHLQGGRSLQEKLRLVGRSLLDLAQGGPRRMAGVLYKRYSDPAVSNDISDYQVWVEFYDDCSEPGVQLTLDELPRLQEQPKFSILLPTYNTDERWLRACIQSVIAQTYPNWELCIADDASTDENVWRVIQEYVDREPRIRAVRREENGHIAVASNSALELASGKYVALLDHDDTLHPLALQHCALAFQAQPAWRMLFTDEDKIDANGRRSDPYFKSDWNPDLFLSQNCVCHLGVYERALLEEIGGFREGFDGAQDWDLTLRATERLTNDQIGHVPKVLYHWRAIEGSTALAPGEKSYAHLAALRAIQEHLDRIGRDATATEMPGYSGYYHIVNTLPTPAPRVSLLIPTRDRVDLLRQCVDSILQRTDYPDFEILILDNGSKEAETHAYLSSFKNHHAVRVLAYDAPFNYSAINNFGARHATGEVLGLLNNDVEVIGSNWLSEMATHAMRPDVGVVGAMLYYPNDTIQHAGVILGIGGVAGHAYVGMPRHYPGDKHRAGLAQNLSAVTAACAVIRKSIFDQVGGLDEGLMVAFNDVDFCLRVRDSGYRNLWTPFAELYHHESASRGYENTPDKIARFKREQRFMLERWGAILERDPYYNPNFSLTNAPFTLAYPPR